MGDYNNAFMRNDTNNPAAVQARAKQQSRVNVMQLKLIGQSHPTGLTANLLKLFEPRPPLEYKPPPDKRKCPAYTGMAQFVSNFAEPGDSEYAPPVKVAETPAQRRARIHKLRLEEGAKKAAEELEKYDPNNNPNISGDPYKTLFVARLNYETTESRIKREFEAYGPIKRIRLVTDNATHKPRGYAFIEYMHTRDMKAAYKQADGKKLDNRRVLVDVERGRTVPNWRPRRLGGGLGTTRIGGEEVDQKLSGREQQQAGGPPRSEEPKIRDDRHGERDREKSRERGRDRDREREREKSRERSHDRPRDRDRDHREDRHHRDRDRNRDKDRERDRGRDRDRDRERARSRDYERERDRDRGRDRDRERDRPREKERKRDYETEDPDHDRGHSHDREYDYDRVESKHDRDRHVEPKDYPEGEDDHGNYDNEHQGRGQYDKLGAHADDDHYDNPDRDQYDDQMEEDYYDYGRAASESREREKSRDLNHDYRHTERLRSREYEY